MLLNHRTVARLGLAIALPVTASLPLGCNALLAAIPALTFCGTPASATQILQLAEGPAIFVSSIGTIAGEVGGQSQTVGTGVDQGFSVQQQALQALGPYHYDGAGSYSRQAATDRSYRVRFFYGSGVPGESADTPLNGDLSQVASYVTVPNFSFTTGFNFSSAQGPLFPLIESTGLTSGKLAFNPDALRLDVGSLVSTTLKGYKLSLALSTARQSLGGLVQELGAKKLTLSLADTSMTNDSLGFGLTITDFDLTVGLDGSASLGGEYGLALTSGGLTYYGHVTTTTGVPTLSLRCSQTADSEFASVSFVSGNASVKFNTQNLPIGIPALAPLLSN